jgi:hypothetical protein
MSALRALRCKFFRNFGRVFQKNRRLAPDANNAGAGLPDCHDGLSPESHRPQTGILTRGAPKSCKFFIQNAHWLKALFVGYAFP